MTMRNLIGMALMVTILAATTFATTVVKLDLEQLVERADLIAQGQVQSVYCQWDEALRLVFTYISILVDDPFKGERGQFVLIRQIGGTVGTIQMSVAGVPRFRSGETVIVFLKRQTKSTFQVVGMNQGLYEITEDFAVSNVSGVDLLDSKTGEITRPVIGGRIPLEQLKTKIRELVR